MHHFALAAVVAIGALASSSTADTEIGITVCPSGCDFTSIQDAINASPVGVPIFVKAGTYNENQINTLGLPFTIRGEVASDGTLLTTISGANFDVDENSSVFYFNHGEGPSTVIENLIIADGQAHGYGGGIQIFNSSPTIKSCTITGNYALYRNEGSENVPTGGGIYLSGSNSLIEDCLITQNFTQWEGMNDAQGGGIYCDEGAPNFSGCHIIDNSIYYTGSDDIGGAQDPCGDCAGPQCGQAEGMGIAGYKTTLTITDCVIDGNTVLNQFRTSCDSNSSQTASSGGGLWFKESTVSITDTIIKDNWARLYGGIYAYESEINLIRCEISGNNDTGIYLDEGSGMISECLVMSNTNAGISLYETTLELTESAVTRNAIGIDAGKEASANIFRTIINDNSYGGGLGGISLSSADGSTGVILSESFLCGNPVGAAGALTSNQVNTGYPSSQVTVDEKTVVSGSCQITLTVAPDGTGDFTNIQDAIDASYWGGTVSIAAGTYPGGITIDNRPVNLTGTIDGDQLPATIIDGGGSQQALAISGRYADNAAISNLNIQNGYTKAGGAGLSVTDASPTIINCVFQGNNTQSSGGGVAFINSNSAMQNCFFFENNASPGGGVYIDGDSSVTSGNCRFIENTGGSGGGAIFVAQGGALSCTDSIFRVNSVLSQFQGGAIQIESGATAELTGNLFCGNTPDQIAGTYTDGGDNTLDAACIRNVTVTVSADGSADFETITAAIGAVGDGSTIQIAAGDYAEELNTQGKAIRLLGSTDAAGAPTTRIVPPELKVNMLLMCNQGETRTTIFENLIFTNGNNSDQGAGAVTCNGTSPTFKNCIMLENFGYNAGGMYCENGSNPLLYACSFIRNYGGFYDSAPGGLASASGSNPQLERCLMCDNSNGKEGDPNITGNWTDLGGNLFPSTCPIYVGAQSSAATPIQDAIDLAPAGGIIFIGSGTYEESLNTNGKALTIRGTVAYEGKLLTTIDGGGDGPVFTCSQGEGTTTVIEDLIITGGSDGGIQLVESSPSISGCWIVGNTATSGGGINASGSASLINGCLIGNNQATQAGGGIAASNSGLQIKQTRITENDAPEGNGLATEGTALPGLQDCTLCGGSGDLVDGNYNDLGGNSLQQDCSIHVSQDATGDFTTIQNAIDSIDAGDPPVVITVAPGVYFEALNTMGKGVVIQGALDEYGRHLTIVDAAGSASVLSCISGETSATTIRDLVLTNGFSGQGSGGIYIWEASPTIENCVVSNNQSYFGGGMSINTSTTSVTGCLIIDNQANRGGGIWTSGFDIDGGITINDCVVSGNQAQAYSAVYGSSTGLSIGDTVICGNTVTVDTQTGQMTGNYNDLGGNVIQDECPVPTCPADLNGDDMIDASDLGRLLSEWTADDPCQDDACLAADLNGDGKVDAEDLAILLGAWGACQ